MRNVLSTRLVRQVLDAWREIAFKAKVNQFSVAILEMRLLQKMFRQWRLECLCELFAARRRAQELEAAFILAHPILGSWFRVTVDLNHRKRIVEAVVLVRRVSRTTYIWIREYREARSLRIKANRVVAIAQSRTLAKSFTCMRELYGDRPASLRFRLNLDSFKKYVPYVRREPRLADTWTSSSLLSTRGDLSPSAIYPPRCLSTDVRLKPLPTLSSPVVTPEPNSSFSQTLPAVIQDLDTGYESFRRPCRPPSLAGLRRKHSLA